MTSSTFDKLLAQQRGALPESTGSYHELEQGDLKYDGVKNINDAIDADIQDFQNRTNWAIEEAKRYHEQKEKNLDGLVGLIGAASNLKKWEDARKESAAIYDKYYSNPFEDVEQEKYVQQEQALNNENSSQQQAQLEITKEGVKDGSLTLDQGIVGANISEAQQLNISGIEAGNEYVDGFQPYMSQALHEKKQLRHPVTGKEMPHSMSYMEVLESDNREIKEFLPWLWRDAVHDYHAAMTKAGLVEKMGDRHFRFKVFPNIATTAETIQQKLFTRQLDISIKNAEERINETTLAEFNTYYNDKDPTLSGLIGFIYGKNGLISSKEITIDGKVSNQKGWEDSGDFIVWGVERGDIPVDVAIAIINSDKIPVRGSDKTTTIEGLKNPNATAFKTKIERAIGLANQKDSRAKTAIESTKVEDFVTEKVEGLHKEFGDKPIPLTAIRKARQEVIQAAKLEGIYLEPTDARLSRFNTLETKVDVDEQKARNILDNQIANERPLSYNQLKYIPSSGDPDGRNYNYYKEWGDDKGWNGLTPAEKEIHESALNRELLNARLITKERLNTEEGQAISNNAAKLFYEYFENNYAAGIKNAGDNPDYEKIKKNAIALSYANFREHVEKAQSEGGEYKGRLSTPITAESSSSQLKSVKQIKQKIQQQGANALTYNRYYPEEKEILTEYIEWKKNPKGMNPARHYYMAFSSNIRQQVTNAGPISEIAEARLLATEHLRVDGEGKDAPPENESNAIDEIREACGKNGIDDSKIAQCAVQPEKLDIMLNDLVMPDRDFDSVYSPASTTIKGRQEENLNNLTYDTETNTFNTSKPLTQRTVEEVVITAAQSEADDKILTFGAYDIKASTLVKMYEEGMLDPNAVFDEETQKEIVWRRILEKAHSRSDNKTWSSTYRRYTYLSKEEKIRFGKIMSSITGHDEYETDPYSTLELLSPGVAKALTALGMGQEIPTE